MAFQSGSQQSISIHAPAKGATFATAGRTNPEVFQSTLPRRERLFSLSICLSCFRFQSTLPRRERPEKPKSVIYMREFQSTLPQRERHVFRTESDSRQDISIHAPAKGATGRSRVGAAAPRYFNPRSREGSDLIRKRYFMQTFRFQSTLLRRERRAGDVADVLLAVISIHAPAKGATVNDACHIPRCEFQSTLPRRERPPLHFPSNGVQIISIHAPAKGATAESAA